VSEYSYQSFINDFLVAICDATQGTQNFRTFAEISHKFEQQIPENWVNGASIKLAALNLISIFSYDVYGSERRFLITGEGVKFVHERKIIVLDNPVAPVDVSEETILSDSIDGEIVQKIDSTSWTGLSQVVVGSHNSNVITSLIDAALEQLDSSDNSDVAQARTLLLAARDLAEAPEPPSDIIWELIQRAGAIVGLLDIFFRIFSTASQ